MATRGLLLKLPAYPSGFSGGWSGSIASGSSHDVTVTFSPTSQSNYNGNVTVSSDATAGTNTIPISGTGTTSPTRVIALSGDMAFGNVTVGTTAQRTLTISNSGNATLNISIITYPSGFSGSWSGALSAGGSHNVTVTFSPTEQASYSGTITVQSDKSSGTNTISASGTGVNNPNPKGDLNSDGNVTPADAQLAFQYYMSGATVTQHPEADVNHSESITPADAQEIFAHYLDPSRPWP